MGIPEGKEREKGEEMFEVIMTKFSKINDRHVTRNPESSDNIKQHKYQNKTK